MFWSNDRSYLEVFEAADPKMTTRTPRNPFLGPFLAIFRLDQNPISPPLYRVVAGLRSLTDETTFPWGPSVL